MKKKTIVFEIFPDGSLQADVEGFRKDTCLKELNALLKSVQAEPLTIERKDQDPKFRKQTHEMTTKQNQVLRRKS